MIGTPNQPIETKKLPKIKYVQNLKREKKPKIGWNGKKLWVLQNMLPDSRRKHFFFVKNPNFIIFFRNIHTQNQNYHCYQKQKVKIRLSKRGKKVVRAQKWNFGSELNMIVWCIHRSENFRTRKNMRLGVKKAKKKSSEPKNSNFNLGSNISMIV
jgi:hypothetical protein